MGSARTLGVPAEMVSVCPPVLRRHAGSRVYGWRYPLRIVYRLGGASSGLHDVTIAVFHILRRSITRCPCVRQRGRRHLAEPSPTRRRWTRQSRGVVGMGVKAAPTTLVYAACFTPPPTPMSRDRQKVSRSSEGLAKMMAIIKTVFEAAGPTHSKKETVTMLPHTRDLAFRDVQLSLKTQDRGINRYSISIPRRRYQRRR